MSSTALLRGSKSGLTIRCVAAPVANLVRSVCTIPPGGVRIMKICELLKHDMKFMFHETEHGIHEQLVNSQILFFGLVRKVTGRDGRPRVSEAVSPPKRRKVADFYQFRWWATHRVFFYFPQGFPFPAGLGGQCFSLRDSIAIEISRQPLKWLLFEWNTRSFLQYLMCQTLHVTPPVFALSHVRSSVCKTHEKGRPIPYSEATVFFWTFPDPGGGPPAVFEPSMLQDEAPACLGGCGLAGCLTANNVIVNIIVSMYC